MWKKGKTTAQGSSPIWIRSPNFESLPIISMPSMATTVAARLTWPQNRVRMRFTAVPLSFTVTPISMPAISLTQGSVPAPVRKAHSTRTSSAARSVARLSKDKIFFFLDYQGTRQTQGQSVNTQVPTAADQTGDITDQLGLLSNAYAASLQPGGSPAGTVQGAQLAQNLSNALGYTVTPGEPYYYG